MKRLAATGSRTLDTYGLAASALPLSYGNQTRCATEAFSTTCAVRIEDCGVWGLVVSWVWLPVAAGLFTFLYFHLITSKFAAWDKMSSLANTWLFSGTSLINGPEAPLPNLSFAKIFYSRFGTKQPNLKTTNISGCTVCACKVTQELYSFIKHPVNWRWSRCTSCVCASNV